MHSYGRSSEIVGMGFLTHQMLVLSSDQHRSEGNTNQPQIVFCIKRKFHINKVTSVV